MGGISNANTSTDARRGNLSFYLRGKALSDLETWMPNMDVVRATIKFAIATGRLDMEVEQASETPRIDIM